MAKLFLISVNIFVVFALKIFFGGDVSIEQKMQDTIAPGDTLNVTLEITKGDREGFAKWQQTIPEGFIASSVEMNGATFSFKNQQIKIIWMELPMSETFSIKYKIETSPAVFGEHNLMGKFSFIEENERRDINSNLFILSVEENTLANNSETELPKSKENLPIQQKQAIKNSTKLVETPTRVEESQIENDVELVNNIDATINNNTVTTKAAQNDLISIEREVKHLEGGNYEVSLVIFKSSLSSFGKVEDYLPPNFSASAIESSDGIFSFRNNVIKILWMTLPKAESFTVKYAMQSTSDELDSAIVHGMFSYLNLDQSVQNKLNPTKFKNFLFKSKTALQLADEGTTDKKVSEVEESFEDESPTAFNSTEKEATASIEEELIEQITNIPAPETSVAYKVQIAASHKEVQQSYFTERHSINEKVSIEFHETWYKYTIGSYPIYKKARDKRNNVWASNNKINDAFVTAYNAGERISVQEALMVSKQKWYK
ncbi:MAG: hypothetical protein ACJARP_001627 [Vicingaceae bacterium]|jgi:hypothetical protein